MGAGPLGLAMDFLKAKLADGAVGTVEAVREARGVGMSQRTLERARGELGVRCYFEKEGKRWMMVGGKDEVRGSRVSPEIGARRLR